MEKLSELDCIKNLSCHGIFPNWRYYEDKIKEKEKNMNIENKNENLATIRQIKSLEPISGADRIELCRFTDVCWQSVVKKGDFVVGQIVIYVQIDTILPDGAAWAQFLKDKNLPGEPIRLRSAKLRGQLSQGIVLPLSVLPSYSPQKDGSVLYDNGKLYDDESPFCGCYIAKIGNDVSEILGIKKYEKSSGILAVETKGNFPSFLRKTDEEKCCSGDTIIITEDGEKTIKNICETKYNGKVLSYNHETNQQIFSEITNYSIQRNNNDWYEIELEDGKILKLTGNHRVWLSELMCYRRVDELTGNEEFLLKM